MKHRIVSFFESIAGQRKKQSLAQKITLLYLVCLLGLLFFVPLFRILSMTDESVTSVGLQDGVMTKTMILLFCYCLFLIARNASLRFRNRSYILFGFQGSQPLVTSVVLMMLLCHILIMSDVVMVTREYMSTNIAMTWGYILVVCFLFLGVLRQLMVARLQWKQRIMQQEVHVHKQTYTHKDDFQSHDMTAKTLF